MMYCWMLSVTGLQWPQNTCKMFHLCRSSIQCSKINEYEMCQGTVLYSMIWFFSECQIYITLISISIYFVYIDWFFIHFQIWLAVKPLHTCMHSLLHMQTFMPKWLRTLSRSGQVFGSVIQFILQTRMWSNPNLWILKIYELF